MSITYLSQEKLDQLKEELKFLQSTKRREVAKRIQEAKELGDLTENAEYADAKDAQSFNEGRILQLENMLKNAIVIQQKNKATIDIGSTFKVKNTQSTREFQIVGSQEADPVSGKISNESPMGKAFLGKRAGETVEIEAPKGKMKFKIIEIL